jgi:NfeD-like C-terminal, partner-binding
MPPIKEALFQPVFTGRCHLSSLFFPSSPQLFPEPAEGIVDRLIAYGQTGRVKYRGTYWSAQLYRPNRRTMIPTGEFVSIIAIRGITLLVVPSASSW